MSQPLPDRGPAPVTIRPRRPGEEALIARWQADPAVEYWLGHPRRGRYDLMERLPHRVWMIERSGEPIGYLGLYDLDEDDRSAEMQICIGRTDLWGRGIGREAIRQMLEQVSADPSVRRIHLRVFADNERAIRCYRAVGFRLEGILSARSSAEGRAVLLMARALEGPVDTAGEAALNGSG
ncbi:MAG: GNAT family N-acetyltransferase [Clostridia bacterium]|nr:GNAT family N-acetyltransferase [Clostridia bacterium]MCL6520819.1 GNAT family N-acetyltransferase [Bacillota bacterium]